MGIPQHISQERIALFEAYLLEEMSEVERSEFEALLKSDAELAAQFEETKILMRKVEAAALKEKMDQFHRELKPAKRIKPQSGRSLFDTLKWPIAVILVSAIGIFWLIKPEDQNEILFTKHFTPDPGLTTNLSNADNYEFLEGMVIYKQGNYDEAISKWSELLNESSSSKDTLNYFLGIAHLAKGSPDQSIDYLQDVWEMDQNNFRSKTALYLGFAYLKSGDLENAMKFLSFSNTEEARAVLSEMND